MALTHAKTRKRRGHPLFFRRTREPNRVAPQGHGRDQARGPAGPHTVRRAEQTHRRRSYKVPERGLVELPCLPEMRGRRAKKLWLVNDAPRCRVCLEKLGVRYRASYGFGRTERLRERDRRVDRLQAMLEGGPMRLKPVPPSWGNRRLDRRNRLIAALQRSRIVTRLAQIAYQQLQSSEPHGPSPLLSGYKPRAVAIEAIPNLKSLWRARSTEDLEIALDKAQAAILHALQSNDPQTRLNAASLMLRSRQARERGWS